MQKRPAEPILPAINVCILHADHTVFLYDDMISYADMIFNDRPGTDLAVISNDHITADHAEGSDLYLFSHLHIRADITPIDKIPFCLRHETSHPLQKLSVPIFRRPASYLYAGISQRQIHLFICDINTAFSFLITI